MRRGKWTTGKTTITGWWCYNWASRTFLVLLDSVDRITGEQRRLLVHNDTPEWGRWKLVREEVS